MCSTVPHRIDRVQAGIQLRSVEPFWPDGMEIWNPEGAFMVGVR